MSPKQSRLQTKKPSRQVPQITVAEIRAESEALFRSIGDGAIATDEFGHITRINPRALAILGISPDEALGKWFPKIVRILRPDGTPMPLIERPIVRMFLTGEAISEKAVYLVKNGQTVPVSITVSPIILAGRPVGAVQVFRDITVENEIDRMKSEFISLASHQLRTPLSTVQTYAHMLDENYMGEVNPEQRRALRTILAASNTMNELIGILLNIARIESGRISVNSKRLNTTVAIQDVLKQVGVAAANKNVALKFKPPALAITIQSDSILLKEILLNLVGNAVKYTPPDGKVSISVKDRDDAVLFTIKDTGVGIPKTDQDKIFAKFFRAQNVVRQETTGTGLGLYAVKGLVHSLQGTVWFKSEEREGTTFYVTLPKVYHENTTL